MTRVLVTGATGFLGRRAMGVLADQGFVPVGTGRRRDAAPKGHRFVAALAPRIPHPPQPLMPRGLSQLARAVHRVGSSFSDASGALANLTSLNVAMNSILKVPDGIFKGLLILNISMNRLKSLNGIESCPRLLFLNANNNQISSINAINQL